MRPIILRWVSGSALDVKRSALGTNPVYRPIHPAPDYKSLDYIEVIPGKVFQNSVG
jgi:hypothetical protein